LRLAIFPASAAIIRRSEQVAARLVNAKLYFRDNAYIFCPIRKDRANSDQVLAWRTLGELTQKFGIGAER
jgi:hypothetical protein